MTNSILVSEITDTDKRPAGWWVSEDRQGQMDWTGATLADAKREMLAECADDEQRDGILRGTLEFAAATAVQEAITDSIRTDSIVTIDGTPDLAAELAERAENWTEGNESVHEYWGDEDGDEWRVHLRMHVYTCSDDGGMEDRIVADSALDAATEYANRADAEGTPHAGMIRVTAPDGAVTWHEV